VRNESRLVKPNPNGADARYGPMLTIVAFLHHASKLCGFAAILLAMAKFVCITNN
jgi:hypothetical protein